MVVSKIASVLTSLVRPALIFFVIWTLVGLSFTVATYIAISAENRNEDLWTVVLNSMARVYVWGALSPLVYLAAKRFVIDPRRITAKPVALNLLCGVVICIVYPLIFVIFAGFFGQSPFSRGAGGSGFQIAPLAIYGWYTFVSMYIPTFLTIQALLFAKTYRNEEAKTAALQAELSDARLNALRMQIQPHFLFNSLHSISSLIILDPSRANQMVSLLGDFLRQTLEHSGGNVVSLSEELEFVRCYLDIEKIRFEDRLAVEFEIEPATLDAQVPHLIVQPIVENAIKHGIAPHVGAGSITISSSMIDRDEFRIAVRNTRQAEGFGDQAVNGNGLGLANVRSRLNNMYGDRATLRVEKDNDSFDVVITLPFEHPLEGEEQPR